MSLSLERVATSLIDDGQKFQTIGWDLVPTLFEQWDSDKSGTISRHEISIALRNFDINASFAQCMQMMNEVDSNNDSELDEKGELSTVKAISVRVCLGSFNLTSATHITSRV